MIFFNVPEAREFLKKNSVVFTLRKKRREGHDLAVYGSYYKWKRIGDVDVKFVDEIRDLEHLKDYVEQSGFETVEEWMSKAHLEARFLYKVSLLESPENNPGTVFVEVRFLKDTPMITGVDMKQYGPFRKGDVAALPKENASVLIKMKVAEKRVKPPTEPTLKEVMKGEVLTGYVEAAMVKPLGEEVKLEEIWSTLSPSTRKSMLLSSGEYPYVDIDITVKKDWNALSGGELRAIEKAWKAIPEVEVRLTGEDTARLADLFLDLLRDAGVSLPTRFKAEFEEAMDIYKPYDENVELIEEAAHRIILRETGKEIPVGEALRKAREKVEKLIEETREALREARGE